MEFYGQSTETATPAGPAATWFDAVNSEFHYDQHRKQDVDLNNNHNQHVYATASSVAHPVLTVHENPLTPAEPIQSNVGYYQRPPYGLLSSYINNERGLLSSPSSSSMYDQNMTAYAPCQGPPPWNFTNFEQCYSFYGQAPCPLVNIIDMEDFM